MPTRRAVGHSPAQLEACNAPLVEVQGGWRKTYVNSAMVSFYFNVFVLVVQLFLKVPVLHARAPNGSEPPFAFSQSIVLIAFIILSVLAVKKFRAGAPETAQTAQTAHPPLTPGSTLA